MTSPKMTMDDGSTTSIFRIAAGRRGGDVEGKRKKIMVTPKNLKNEFKVTSTTFHSFLFFFFCFLMA